VGDCVGCGDVVDYWFDDFEVGFEFGFGFVGLDDDAVAIGEVVL